MSQSESTQDTDTTAEPAYEDCNECGNDKAHVYYANKKTCLVAECTNCGAQIAAKQANPEYTVTY